MKELMIKHASAVFSLLLHIILLAALLFSLSRTSMPERLIEVSFGEPGGGSGGASAAAESQTAENPEEIIPGSETEASNDEESVKLHNDKPDEETVKKSEENSTKQNKAAALTAANAGNNTGSVKGRGGQGTNPYGTGIGNGWGTGSGNGNGNGNGQGDGTGDGYSISFGGRVRKIYSYRIPKYPEGVTKQIDIRLKFTILPDGSIGQIFTLTKADSRLENAAISSLRLWRFEPLEDNMAKQEQTAVIVFPFRLN